MELVLRIFIHFRTLTSLGNSLWPSHLESKRTAPREVFSSVTGANSRPYKVFLTTPTLFCCAAIFLLLNGVFTATVQALLAAMFLVAGIPVYCVLERGWRPFPCLCMCRPRWV